MLIGITGGSGCGKSEAAAVFESFGAKIIDADKIARDVTKKGGKALADIEAAFGGEYIAPDGTLLRKKLGSLVFADGKMLDKLNAVIGKYIKKEIDEKIKNSGGGILILDAPLLLEYGLERQCDAVVAVLAERSVRTERIMQRDRITRTDAENRINSQKKDEYYLEKADFIVYNNSTRGDMQARIKEIIEKLKETQ